jgi:hypothetical protein
LHRVFEEIWRCDPLKAPSDDHFSDGYGGALNVIAALAKEQPRDLGALVRVAAVATRGVDGNDYLGDFLAQHGARILQCLTQKLNNV